MEEKRVYINIPEFTGENVPVAVAARVMKKDQQFIRQGIILGFLKFGVAFKKEGSSQYEVEHGIYSKEQNINLDAWFCEWLEVYQKNFRKKAG